MKERPYLIWGILVVTGLSIVAALLVALFYYASGGNTIAIIVISVLGSAFLIGLGGILATISSAGAFILNAKENSQLLNSNATAAAQQSRAILDIVKAQNALTANGLNTPSVMQPNYPVIQAAIFEDLE